jgi:hypothetical protein
MTIRMRQLPTALEVKWLVRKLCAGCSCQIGHSGTVILLCIDLVVACEDSLLWEGH